jgi:FkbM family methyltransferase
MTYENAATPSEPHRRICIVSGARDASLWAPMRSAAEFRGYELVTVTDANEFDANADFIVISGRVDPKATALSTFRVMQDVAAPPCNRERREQAAAYDGFLYDGFLAVRDSPDRFFGDGGGQSEEPFVGFFAPTPERQFLACQLSRLSDLAAIRLCHVALGSAPRSPHLLAALSNRSYWRRYRNRAAGSQAPAPRAAGPMATHDKAPTRLYAASGIGLAIPDENGSMDAEAFHSLCQIVSVGAVALSPDIPWVRRLFGDSIHYYPVADPAEAIEKIDRVVEEVRSDAVRAAGRAREARRIFEERLAADVMLRNAIDVFERWQARPRRRAPETIADGTVVDTSAEALVRLFERLPDKILQGVASTVATLKPLQPMPEWRFGGFLEDRDIAAHVRHGLWLAAHARGRQLPVVIDWHEGTRLEINLDNDLSLTLFSGGCFEPNEFAFLDRMLKPGMVFIDGGANEGVYTVFAAARLGPTGRVIAVEPSPRELARLRRNLALNKMRRVTVVDAALADRPGSVLLLVAETKHGGQNTLGAFAYHGVASVETREVQAITLDELAAEHGLTQLDVLKLDVEGAELRALQGGAGVLAAFRPLIMIEVLEPALNHQGCTSDALLHWLDDAGYVLLIFRDTAGAPTPLRPGERLSDNVVAVHRARDFGLLEAQSGPALVQAAPVADQEFVCTS